MLSLTMGTLRTINSNDTTQYTAGLTSKVTNGSQQTLIERDLRCGDGNKTVLCCSTT